MLLFFLPESLDPESGRVRAPDRVAASAPPAVHLVPLKPVLAPVEGAANATAARRVRGDALFVYRRSTRLDI